MDRAVPWHRGDWYLSGLQLARERDPKREFTDIQLASEIRSLGEFLMSKAEWKTCQNNASVAKAFPLSLRRERLTYNHHAIISSLDRRQQTKWLDLCETESLSVADLRQRLRTKDCKDNKSNGEVVYVIDAEISRMVRWLKAQDLTDEPERRAAIKKQLEPLVEFANAL